MSISRKSLQFAVAGVLAAATIGSAAPAYAGPADTAERCEAQYERLEDRFREIEERRGWDAAAEWWNEHGWPKYYERCLAPQA
jgi:hypothetical protein